MPKDLVTIATFMSNAEAGPPRTALETAGIRTYLQGGATADMLSHVGTALGGVKLQVAAEDQQRAIECLGLSLEDPDISDQHPWDCHNCGAKVDAGFEVCWSCGAEFDEEAAGTQHPPEETKQSPPTDTDQPSIDCPMCGQLVEANSDSCPSCGEQFDIEAVPSTGDEQFDEISEHARHADELLGRAFRASIIGTALCPPLLNIYSVLQLVEFEALRREVHVDADWRLPTTYAVNAAVILFEVALILYVIQ